MEWRTGDLVDIARAEGAAVAFTANAVIKVARGQELLVMGLGAAKRVRDAYPGVDALLAAKIRAHSRSKGVDTLGKQPSYYVAPVMVNSQRILAVQTKSDYRDHLNPTDKAYCFQLTQKSLQRLAGLHHLKPEIKIVLNCPLINHGGYADEKEKVQQMVENYLADTDIIVCTL